MNIPKEELEEGAEFAWQQLQQGILCGTVASKEMSPDRRIRAVLYGVISAMPVVMIAEMLDVVKSDSYNTMIASGEGGPALDYIQTEMNLAKAFRGLVKKEYDEMVSGDFTERLKKQRDEVVGRNAK